MMDSEKTATDGKTIKKPTFEEFERFMPIREIVDDLIAEIENGEPREIGENVEYAIMMLTDLKTRAAKGDI